MPALQNFKDLVGPAVSASWLNIVDTLCTTVFGQATTAPAARSALCSDLPLEVANGGTAARSLSAARASLTSDAPWSIAQGGTGQTAAGQALLVALGLSQGVIGNLLNPQASAESTAGITPANYSYHQVNILRYGADPTGTTASDTALSNAIAVCSAQGGGTIYAPAGTYIFTAQINLANKLGIVIQGEGATTSGAAAGTVFKYTSTGAGVWVNMNSATGCQFRNVQLTHSQSTFTGTYIQCNNDGTHGDPSFCGLFDCTLGANVSDVLHLDLNKCINFTAERCSFQYFGANGSVRGQQTGGYSNVVRFRDCEWFNGSAAPINGQGQSWTFSGCTFEGLRNGAPGGIAGATAALPAIGLVVSGCWFGDVTATVGAWISGDINGAVIQASYISGNTNGTTGIALSQSSGVLIEGNEFASCLNAIQITAGNCYGLVSKANTNTGSINPYVGTDTFVPLGQIEFQAGYGMGIPPGHGSLGQNGYRVNTDGSIDQWGFVNPAVYGNNTVLFPKAFPTACDNVDCTLSGVSSTQATIYPSALTVSGFTALIQDGTATSDSFYWRARGR